MTEVETLLAVDAGKTPPGTAVFYPRDPDASYRRLRVLFALMVGGSAVGCLFAGYDPAPIALLGILAAILTVSALPTLPEPDAPRSKPPVLVVTGTGMIVRDDGGLRTWLFDDLCEVRPYYHEQGVGLLVVDRAGARHFIDTQSYDRGERVGALLAHRLQPRAG